MMTEDIKLRDGALSDREWLYELFKETMKQSIEATWGWDEDFQRSGFDRYLKQAIWKIIENGSEKLGGFVISENADHLVLKLMVIKPEWQRKGVGRQALLHILNMAKQKSLAVRLGVMKANPVKSFYLSSGFYQYDEDDSCVMLQWRC